MAFQNNQLPGTVPPPSGTPVIMGPKQSVGNFPGIRPLRAIFAPVVHRERNGMLAALVPWLVKRK